MVCIYGAAVSDPAVPVVRRGATPSFLVELLVNEIYPHLLQAGQPAVRLKRHQDGSCLFQHPVCFRLGLLFDFGPHCRYRDRLNILQAAEAGALAPIQELADGL
jgi:hypothetical protein